ncbi:arginine deiminase [Pseudalkalibacillus decolorationis]|uniref:arginine deiminase n=1 Tax=Pseudalkalibacillus decolorationis TaxID=163879 RepID=UPI002148E907|nr:arginine deiminase [Pseudalkalibacillus decolorationis]
MSNCQVFSEIQKLEVVLVHEPDQEIQNVTPEYLEHLLFEDIPYLPNMQSEHQAFSSLLRSHGVEVLYLKELMEVVLSNEYVKTNFIKDVLHESRYSENGAHDHLFDYLQSLRTSELLASIMAGILKTDVPKQKKTHLYELMDQQYPFYLDPMPNLYFTRDPAAVIGEGISVNRMKKAARRRESLFIDYISKHHKLFQDSPPVYFSRDTGFPLEGGDQLVLSEKVIAIGAGERTSAQGIEKLAKEIFSSDTSFEKIVAVEIPHNRAFMHLDTIFTMVDKNKFTVHPVAFENHGHLKIFILEKVESDGEFAIYERSSLIETLKEVLDLDEIVFIPCGGQNEIISSREQWNDGSNTLTLSPGVVVTYDRNEVSNRLLREHGVEVLEIESAELSRGRGGPRCMSMPIKRTRQKL